MAVYMNAKQAAAALGIRQQTLYSYVSRGQIQSLPGDDHRERRFRTADVEKLASQKSVGRKPKHVAKATLDWGLPVLESGLTLIEDGQLYFRGRSVADLAESASLEDIARILWSCEEGYSFDFQEEPPSLLWKNAMRSLEDQSPIVRCAILFSLGHQKINSNIWQRDRIQTIRACLSLLRLLTASALCTEPNAKPIHMQCQKAWNLDDNATDIVRTALVVCADHELNASSFTARCIASTGASIGAAITGGLAALSGPLHGGFTERVEALFKELEASRSFKNSLQERLTRGDIIPGFGHPLYPDGDPRAKAILAKLPRNRELNRIIEIVETLTGKKPTIDFALVAARRHLGLPAGSAFSLFAIGRTVGWIAHVLEQREQRSLIRPRANYIGPRP
ncbi:MAG TPA: citrate synthase family protein [Burkholderiaceae bacterium]